jgi:hypothetical protein
MKSGTILTERIHDVFGGNCEIWVYPQDSELPNLTGSNVVIYETICQVSHQTMFKKAKVWSIPTTMSCESNVIGAGSLELCFMFLY